MERWAVEKSSTANRDFQDGKKEGSYEGLFNEVRNGFNGIYEIGKCQKRNRAVAFGFNFEESDSKLYMKRPKESGDDDEVIMSSDVNDESEEEGLDLSWKKEGDLSDMLKWLTLVAKSPDDPSIGLIPYCSKWNKSTGKEVYFQAIRAKNSLLVQRDNAQVGYRNFPILDHYTVHPSMYDDDRKSIGRLRYSLRDKTLSKHQASSFANGSWVSRTKSRKYKRASRVTKTSKAIGFVPVGPNYQAEVDEWTEESRLDSDAKWLGTPTWPLENNQTIGNDLIGKGRPTSCSCDFPNSVECVRFHIAEKRMELKGEIGNAFFHWRFNQMGEEESLSWTESEEKKFKEMMTSDPVSFWTEAVSCFKQKKRVELVRYYFNVFLINKRRYQNRTTPRDIDSDTDEPFGAVGNRFGEDAVTSFGSDGMICTLNRQCEDYDRTGINRK